MEWRNSLYHYEENPPNKTWEIISKELDNDVPAVREALYDYSEQPPVASWEIISATLDRSDKPARVWYRRPLTYVTAAAAAVAGVIFISNNIGEQKNIPSPDISASVYKSSTEESSKKTDSQTLPQQLQLAILENDKEKNRDSEKSFQKPKVATVHPMKFDPDDENYIYLTTSTGELRRLNYKFEDMLREMKRQDSEQIQKWKEKLQKSSFIPTGNNFFDIAEMIRILQDEKRP